MAYLKGLQDLGHTVFPFANFETAETVCNIVLNRKMWKEGEVLKYKGNSAFRSLDSYSLPRIKKSPIAHSDASLLRITQTRNASQNRRLAGAGMAHDDR